MALRNALGDLALDETVAALTAAVEALGAYVQRQEQTFPARALQYARTPTDAMRVNVDGGNVDVVRQVSMWVNGGYALWYAGGGPNSMDVREQQRELSQQTFHQTRNSRWVIS